MSNQRKVTSMMLFANGQIAAFDEDDKQIPELQSLSAIQLWAERAIDRGYDVIGCKFSTQKPYGHGSSGTLIKCFDGVLEQIKC